MCTFENLEKILKTSSNSVIDFKLQAQTISALLIHSQQDHQKSAQRKKNSTKTIDS